jgi:hypothetical protein
MKLFVPTLRDLIRVAIFAVLGSLVLPLFPAVAFTGGAICAVGIGIVFAASYLVGGSTLCYLSRKYRLPLEQPLPALTAMICVSLFALKLVIPMLALGLVVSGWLPSLLIGIGLTVVAGLSTINEPRS